MSTAMRASSPVVLPHPAQARTPTKTLRGRFRYRRDVFAGHSLRLSAAILAAVGGCTSSPSPEDAAHSDALIADAGADTRVGDAGADAGPVRCEDQAIEPWDLSTGSWSTAFAPRGLSFDGPRGAHVADLDVHDRALYAGGTFSHAGPHAARHAARWDEASGWSALGDGPPRPLHHIVVAPDGTVYGAEQVEAEGDPAAIYRFDGAAWVTLGITDHGVEDLAIDVDGTLLAGGNFRSIDSVTARGLARWDGTSWTSVDHRGGGQYVTAILADASGLCVGSADSFAGLVACESPSAPFGWESFLVPEPTESLGRYPIPVQSIVRDVSGALVIGGGAYVDDAPQEGGVLRWSGTEWERLGGGLSGLSAPMEVYSLARTRDDSLYAVGDFAFLGSRAAPSGFAQRIARFSGGRWRSIGGVQGGSPTAAALGVDGDTVYVGGQMEEAFGTAPADWHGVAAVARFDGETWSALAQPSSEAHGPGDVGAIAVRGGCRPVVAGGFQVVEDRFVAHVGRVAVGGAITDVATTTGLNDGPWALAFGTDGALYAAGYLEIVTPGGSVHAVVARHADGEWEAIDGLDAGATVLAIAAGDGVLYAGGRFEDPMDASRSHLRQWDGASWTAVGARGEPREVSAMLYDDGALFIAEVLETGGARVSRWASGTWSVLGDQLAGEVRALAVSDGVLFAGGDVLIGTSLVARFDVTSWASADLADGTGWDRVQALATLGPDLVAGLDQAIGDYEPGRLMRRSATGWEPLATIDGAVSSLAFVEEGLLVGGSFEVVDGVPSRGLALLERP